MDKLKVQVPTRGIDARDLDDHALPQLVTDVRVGARQRKRVLVKLEPLVARLLIETRPSTCVRSKRTKRPMLLTHETVPA